MEKDMQSKKVYSAEDIQQLLGVGRSKVYEYLEKVYKDQKPFRVLKIGRIYRIPKDSFDRWINGEEQFQKEAWYKTWLSAQKNIPTPFLSGGHGIIERKY